jgi:dUTPase
MIKRLFRRLFPEKVASIEYFSTYPLIFSKGFPQACLGSETRIGLKGGDSTTLFLGVHVHLPESVTMMVLLKPGLCTTRGIVQDFPEMLPPGYRGNLRLRVTNRSGRTCYFSPENDIALLIPLGGIPVKYTEKALREVDIDGFNQLSEY